MIFTSACTTGRRPTKDRFALELKTPPTTPFSCPLTEGHHIGTATTPAAAGSASRIQTDGAFTWAVAFRRHRLFSTKTAFQSRAQPAQEDQGQLRLDNYS